MLSFDQRLLTSSDILSNKNINQVELYERQLQELLIDLRKSSVGLGFTLGSVENWEKGGTNVFVKKILDFSPAKIDGRLQTGDKIRKINGVDVTNYTQSDIVKILRSVAIGDITNITIERCLLAELGRNIPIPSNRSDDYNNNEQCLDILVSSSNPNSTTISNSTQSSYTSTNLNNNNNNNNNEEEEVVVVEEVEEEEPNGGEGGVADIVDDENNSNNGQIHRITRSMTNQTICEGGRYSRNSKLNYIKQLHHFVISVSDQTINKLPNLPMSSGVLGISVECRSQSSSSASGNLSSFYYHKSREYFVKSILETGTAYKDGRLKLEDEIVAVQGIDVSTGNKFIVQDEQDRLSGHNNSITNHSNHSNNNNNINTTNNINDIILGDVYHYNLAAVFIKNLQKLNKLNNLRSMFAKSLCNQPLAGLKTLIKEAANLYSSISLVIVRKIYQSNSGNNLNSEGCLDNEYGYLGMHMSLDYTTQFNENQDDLRKNCGKKSLSELCQIENIFELNPDYRYSYSSGDSYTSQTSTWYKEDDLYDINGGYHDDRYRDDHNDGQNGDSRGYGAVGQEQYDRHSPTAELYIDEYEYDKALIEGTDHEQLYNYFAKDTHDNHGGLEASSGLHNHNTGGGGLMLGNMDVNIGFQSEFFDNTDLDRGLESHRGVHGNGWLSNEAGFGYDSDEVA